VRRAIDLEDGSTKVLKMVFHEEFDTRVGDIVIKCFRSPKKEGRILDLVADHPNFMHGFWVEDTAGNNVRIIEYISGRQFVDIVAKYGSDHEDYFYNYFPKVLDQYIELVEAIQFLHENGEKHGDIRRDHILFDASQNVNRWIDFDYNYMHGESKWGFDLLGLGNIIIFLVGRGDVLVPDLYHNQRQLFDALWGEDLNISYKNRVANLQKIYGYIPDSLNRILLHFSYGARIFYEIYLVIKQAWDWIYSKAIKPVLDVIWEVIQTVFNAISSFLSAIWNSIKSAASAAWELVKRYIIDPVKGASSETMGLFQALVDWLRQKWEGIRDFFISMKDAIGKAIVAPFEWAKEKIEKIAEKIKDLADKINPFHKESPSLVENVEKGVGKIIDQYQGLVSALNGMDFRGGVMQFAGDMAGNGGTKNITINNNNQVNDGMDAQTISERMAFELRANY